MVAKRKRAGTLITRRRAICAAVAACFNSSVTLANPTGPQVTVGQASFNSQGPVLNVINTPGTVIQWQRFSIGTGETTRFTQQSAQSAVLNRVLLPDPSAILGTLSSNGKVFLINPAGILVGAGGRVDVAGFVASTLNLTNEDFAAGRLRFQSVPNAGSVVNEGTITSPSGGQVYLIAPAVTNSGVINTPRGETILAAGNKVELIDTSTPGVTVQIDVPGGEAKNLGRIVADSGRIGIVGALVQNRGRINADQVVGDGSGRIFLKASKNVTLSAGSETTANGERGGRIEIAADNTATIEKGALVQANGTKAGGNISVSATAGDALVAGSVQANGGTQGGSIKVTSAQGAVRLDGELVVQAAAGAGGNVAIAAASNAALDAGSRIAVNGQSAGGTVTVTGGANVALDAGAAVRANGDTDGAVTINSDRGATNIAGAIEASGENAAGGRVQVSAATDVTVGEGAIVRASGARGGTVYIEARQDHNPTGTTSVAGLIDVFGHEGEGGKAFVLAPHVAIIRNGAIYASGKRGGGIALVGGDYQGKNAQVPNATTSYVGPDASIKADAIDEGDGGKVIVWSNEATRVYGSISARGGAQAGNGGFVETSGHYLDVTRAPIVGAGGTWLLDPDDITISPGSDSNISGTTTFIPSGSGSVLNQGTLRSALQSGGTVEVDTTSSGTGNGDITVDATAALTGINAGPSAALIMKADHDINIRSSISSSPGYPLNITMQAHKTSNAAFGSVYVGADISTNGGTLVIGGGIDPTATPAIGYNATGKHYGVCINDVTLSTSGGNITIRGQGANNVAGGAHGIHFVTGSSIDAGGGNILLVGQGGNNPSSDTSGVYLGGGTLTTASTGNITVRGSGGSGISNNTGVKLQYTTVRVQDGALSITGYGGNATANGNKGVLFDSGPYLVEATGAGTVSITGTACAGCSNTPTYDNDGISFRSGGTVRTAGGSITITGTGAGNGNGYPSYAQEPWNANTGVFIAGSITANATTGSAPVVITGTGSTGGGAVTGSGTSAGVSVSGGTITAAGTRNVTLSSHDDVAIGSPYGWPTSITSADGNIVIRAGNTGSGTGTVNLSASGTTVGRSSGSGHTEIYYNPASYADSATKSDTDSNPYTSKVAGALTAYMLVNDVNQLQSISDNLHGIYALSKDIDAGATSTWNSGAGFAPIGYDNTVSGILDGGGHVVSNLVINRPASSNVALIEELGTGGVVRNIGLAGGSVTGLSYVGALVGENSHGVISNAYSTAGVTGTTYYVGGLVGQNFGGTISNAYSTGAVSGDHHVGGLVGQNFEGDVSNAYSTGAVSGNYYVGGLVGQNAYGTISNAYSTGAVAGDHYVGGLVGQNIQGAVSNAYSTGAVTGNYSVGGLVGQDLSGTITNGYWDTDTAGPVNNGIGTPLSTVDFRDPSMLAGLGFTAGDGNSSNIWWMIPGETRPFLRSEYSTTITNAHQLQLMAMDVGAQYTVARDIDMSELTHVSGMWDTSKGFVPVGGYAGAANFSGTFDGGGHVISNLFINRPADDYAGLFGQIDSTASVNKVTLQSASVTGSYYVGALTGANYGSIGQVSSDGAVSGYSRVGGLVGKNESSGTITNAHSSGTVDGIVDGGEGSYVGGLAGKNYGTITKAYSTAQVTGGYSIGGLVGYNTGSILDSHSTGQVNGVTAWSNDVGGLVGYNGGSIAGSYSTGSVNVPDSMSDDIGGLVGDNEGSITRSYSAGPVSAPLAQAVGGLVGDNNGGTITLSYSSGAVVGDHDVGGLVGENDSGGSITDSYSTGAVSAATYDAGGLVGINYGTIDRAYSTGMVTAGESDSGGLVGLNTMGPDAVTNSFWDIDTSAQSYSDGGMGLNTAQLMKQSNFTSATSVNGYVNPRWNFADGWNIVEDKGYPYFNWRFSTAPQIVSGTLSGLSSNGAQAVNLVTGGNQIGQLSTGANGFYHTLFDASTIPSGAALLSYVPGSALADGMPAAHVRASDVGDYSQINLASGVLGVSTSGSVSLSNGALIAAKGAFSDPGIPYTSSGNHLTLATGVSFATGSGSSYTLDANITTTSGGITFNGPVAMASGANLTAGDSGTITFTADSMDFSGGGVFTTAGKVVLRPSSSALEIDVSSSKPSGKLGISSSDLSHVNAPTLEIGSSRAGALTISAPLDLTATPIGTLVLKSGADISQAADAPVSVSNLAADAGRDVNLPADNRVGTLAGISRRNFVFNNAQSLTIGSVAAYNGVLAVDGGEGWHADVDIQIAVNGGDLTVNQAVTADASYSSEGNAASISLSASDAIMVDGAYIIAHGAYSYAGSGGAGSVTLTASGAGITVQNGSLIRADGGEGLGYSGTSNGGAATITLNGSNGPILVDGSSSIEATGADSDYFSGGAAQVMLATSGSITIRNDSWIAAQGGAAYWGSGYGGLADITLSGGTDVGISGSVSPVLHSLGGQSHEMGSEYDGSATIAVTGANGSITVGGDIAAESRNISSVTLAAPNGSLVGAGGILSTTGNASSISLTALEGIGQIGHPIRIDDTWFPTVSACNGGDAGCAAAVSGAAGDIVISQTNGNLWVADYIGSGNLHNRAPNGGYDFTAESGDLYMGTEGYLTLAANGSGNIGLHALNAGHSLTVYGGSTVQTSGGTITYTADNMTLNGTTDAGAGTIHLRTATPNQEIILGGADGTELLGIDSTDLASLRAGTLRIGRNDVDNGSGYIYISQPLDLSAGPYPISTLELISRNTPTGGNSILQDSGSPITVSNLAVEGRYVDLQADNRVGTLAGKSGVNLIFKNAQTLTIGSVAGYNGVSIVDGGEGAYVSISTSTGDINVTRDVSATGSYWSADIVLDAAGALSVANSRIAAAAPAEYAAEVTLTAGGSIDGSSGHVVARDATITSLHGGAAGTPAITLGTEVSGGLTATVGDAASYGGIRIDNTGSMPASVTLTDNATAQTASSIHFGHDGSMVLDNTQSFTATAPLNLELVAGGAITLNSALSASGTGDALILAGSSFTNNVLGTSGLDTPHGRWLVYSNDPAADVRGSLVYDFKHYGIGYSGTPYAGPGIGNGFIYGVTPHITATLIGMTGKQYDATTAASLASSNYATTGAIDGDTVAVTHPAAGVYSDKNAGTGKLVSATVELADAANGAISVHGYQLSSTTASGYIGEITPAPLTVSATGHDKVYDATTGATVALSDNRLGADVLALGYGRAAFNDKNVETGKTVTVSGITVTGPDAANYSFNTTASNTANITPASLMIGGVTANNKVYEANTAATLNTSAATLTGVFTGDSVTLTNGTGSFADKNVGVAKPVSAAGFALSGTDAANYALTQPSGLAADITPAALTASGWTASNKVYDGSTVAVVSAGSVSGALGTDVVSVSGGGVFADKNVGVAKPVTISRVVLSGADAGNYTVTKPSGTLAADISAKPLATWVVSGGGLWSSSANWDHGVVPEGANVLAVSLPGSAGAVVTYDASAGSTTLKTLESSESVVVKGGSLTLGTAAGDASKIDSGARLELQSGAAVALVGDLTAANYVQSGGSLTGSGNLAVGSSFSQSGGGIGLTGAAKVTITQAAGNLAIGSVSAPSVALNAQSGAITQSAPLVAAAVATQSVAGTGLTNSGNRIGNFSAVNSGSGDIALVNTGALSIGGITNSGGNVSVDNTGAVSTVGAVSAAVGAVSITAHSPLTIGAGGVSAARNIALTAGESGKAGDDLTLGGAVASGGGAIALVAGDGLYQKAQVTNNGGSVSALAQHGNVEMLPLPGTTSSNGGRITYEAALGDVVLTSLDAGSGAIDLKAGGSSWSAGGFSGANLVGASAVITIAGNANFSTQVQKIDANVNGAFAIRDVATGTVMTNASVSAPPADLSAPLQQTQQSVVAAVNTSVLSSTTTPTGTTGSDNAAANAAAAAAGGGVLGGGASGGGGTLVTRTDANGTIGGGANEFGGASGSGGGKSGAGGGDASNKGAGTKSEGGSSKEGGKDKSTGEGSHATKKAAVCR